MQKSCWQIDGSVAQLHDGPIHATLSALQPASGVSLHIGDTARGHAWNVLGVQFDGGAPIDPARIDAYVRGDDFVATYDEVPPRHLRAQIYWRRLKPAEFLPQGTQGVAAALDLIVSVNTSLLDSDPQSSVVGSITSAAQLLGLVGEKSPTRDVSVRSIEPGSEAGQPLRGFIVRAEPAQFSYVEIVHPAESCRSEARWENHAAAGQLGSVRLSQHLFQQRLEKGVILRGWIRAAVVARGDDERVAVDAYRHFASSQPPLTV